MKIKKEETEIKCQVHLKGKKLIESSECERIEWLRKNYLVKLATNLTEWSTLHQDPEDGRYWEHMFEHAEMQDGGPASLINIRVEEAKRKYTF